MTTSPANVQLHAMESLRFLVDPTLLKTKRNKPFRYDESLALLKEHLDAVHQSGLHPAQSTDRQAALLEAFCRLAPHIQSPTILSKILSTFNFAPHSLGAAAIVRTGGTSSASPPAPLRHDTPDSDEHDEPEPESKRAKTDASTPAGTPPVHLMSKRYLQLLTAFSKTPTRPALNALNARVLKG